MRARYGVSFVRHMFDLCSPFVIAVLNTLRPRQYGRHFPDDIFKCIFVNDNVLIWIQISLKFVRKGLINNIPSLVQIMAWRWPGDKPLSEPMMIILLTHICVTRPQWVNVIPWETPLHYNNIPLYMKPQARLHSVKKTATKATIRLPMFLP